MHFEGLDLNLLVALDALLSEKNVTRAAERVHVSQPAMSASLQKLRLHLADPLLERVGRNLELTPRGHTLAGPLKDLLFRVRNLVERDMTFDPATAERIFRLSMTSYCAEVFGIRLVKHLALIAPNVSCQLDELSSNAMTRVNEGQVDICIALARYARRDPGYVEEHSCEQLLLSDLFVLVGHEDNQLLAGSVDYDAFCRQPYVEVRLAGTVLSTVEEALRRRERRPHVSAWVPTFQQAMSMISGTRMVAIVPSRLFALHGAYYSLKAVPAPLPLEELDETAFWHPRSDGDSGHRWLRKALAQIATALPKPPEELLPRSDRAAGGKQISD